MIKKLAILFLLSICLTKLQAAELLGFPRGCEAMGFEYDNESVVFNHHGAQTLYFIQNISNSIIEIKHKSKSPVVVDLGWQATLAQKRWAGFAINEANMLFNCQSLDKGKVHPVTCHEVIRICQYPRVKFTLSNQGNYWIDRNKSLRKVMSKAINRGILLSW